MSEPIGERISHYKVVELLGAGGMGAVYRAHDERLGRDLALKILPAETMCDDVARARLVREARTASALNHPHIAQVYDAGEDKSRLFIAMELVEGKTLHDAIPDGGLPAEVALRYGLQIADALAAAHARGVIHRDLKSTNIMITPEGRVKVLDFGLAKRLGEDEPEGATSEAPKDVNITTAGLVLGTPNHLPPEVLRGQAADARSDVWALGIVLYEMVSGRFPFSGSSMPELAASITTDEPTPLSGRIPLGIRSVIARCLQKDPTRRYHSGNEVRTALETLDGVSSQRGRTARAKFKWGALVGGAIATVLVVAAFLFIPRPPALRDKAHGGATATRIHSLAVLPLVNISGDPAQEYFADGMTEELITNLASIRELKVISRTSVMRFKGTKDPLKDVAKALGVDAVVEGSVQRAGDRVRITAQLIEAASDRHLWAQSFERDFEEVLTLQSEVAMDIARQIQVTLAPHVSARMAAGPHVNPAAYELYLKGRYEWSQLNEASVRKSIEYFEKALMIDPKDPRANSGMADAYLLLVQVMGAIPPREGMKQVKEYATRALAADPNSAEAHASIASAHLFGDWNVREAEKEIDRAIALNPGYSSAYVVQSVILSITGRSEQALAADRKAIELDPLSLIAQWHAIHALRAAGRFDEAIAQADRADALAPGTLMVQGLKAHILEQKKDCAGALDILERYLPEEDGGKASVAMLRAAYEKGGERAYWEESIRQIREKVRPANDPGITLGYLYASLGDKEKAIASLERAAAERSSDMLFIHVEPAFRSLRGEPRFDALVRRIGVPTT